MVLHAGGCCRCQEDHPSIALHLCSWGLGLLILYGNRDQEAGCKATRPKMPRRIATTKRPDGQTARRYSCGRPAVIHAWGCSSCQEGRPDVALHFCPRGWLYCFLYENRDREVDFKTRRPKIPRRECNRQTARRSSCGRLGIAMMLKTPSRGHHASSQSGLGVG